MLMLAAVSFGVRLLLYGSVTMTCGTKSNSEISPREKIFYDFIIGQQMST